MNAKKVAKTIVSNISSFCEGYFGKPIPSDAIPSLERSTATEVKEYRSGFYANGAAVCELETHTLVYRAQSPKQAQEIADAFSTYV